MMRKYVKKVLGFWGIILLRTIKGYFKSNNEQFKDLLLGKGFHLSIANNPFIVFNNYKSVLPTIYIHFYAQFVIKKVSFCIRRNCWKNDICLKLLRIVGLQQAYLYDIKLMFEKIPNRKPCTEIKIPENLLINERVVVYSVMIGNYDEVLDPVYVSDNCDYILFTDNANIKTNVWKVHLIEPSEESLE